MIEVTAQNYDRLMLQQPGGPTPRLTSPFLCFNAIQLINNLLLQQSVRYELLMNANMWWFSLKIAWP